MLRLHNTLTKKLEPITIEPGKKIRVYSCGPTVYAPAHIGNLRSFVFADTLVRTLHAQKVEVQWVMNITDIDDKTIAGAIQKFGQSATTQQLQEYTDEFTQQFIKDLEKVGVDTNHITFIPISQKVTAMGAFINKLVEKSYAYKTESGDVFFSIEKYNADFHDYGALVGEKFLEGKKIGARVISDEYEKDALSDFALWKAHDPKTEGNIYWEVEGLAKGRPGWHIECSVVNHEVFDGQPTDIHTGGIDLIFPHHTNEIAQAQPIYKPFVKTWCHSDHLLVDNKKMAKSAGNFYTLADVEAKGFDPIAFRYLLLTTHYQTQVNFTWESLESSQAGLQGLRKKFAEVKTDSSGNIQETHPLLKNLFEALNNNLNTAESLATLWEIAKSNISNGEKAALLAKGAQVLGLKLETEQKELPGEIKEKVEKLIRTREQLRKEKKFAEADALRIEVEKILAPFGYTIKDTPTGSEIE